MPFGSRSRSRPRGIYASGGVLKLSTNTYRQPPASGTSDYETCSDTTMAPPYVTDHSLVIQRKLSNPLTINGVANEFIHGNIRFDNWMPQDRALYAYCPTPTTINWSYWKTKALANMDPYKPVVDIPLFLFELKDFPGMLKDLGRVLARKAKASDVPGGYLAHQFGWAPLIDDLKSLLNLQKDIEDRMRYYRKLEWGSKIKRTLYNKELVRTTTKDGYKAYANVPSVGKWAYTADVEVTEHIRIWYTANAVLLQQLPITQGGLRRLAVKSVLGLTARPETLWNAIPWTWLSDYFANIGDYIEANQGYMRLKCTRLNLMCTQDCRSSLVNPRLASGLSATESLLQTVSKSRNSSINPTPRITSTPFLSGKQQSILGALATASALRSVKR